MPALVDLTGRVFGRLTVLGRDGVSTYGQPRWSCECRCGATISVFGNSLRTGACRSCGCLQRESVTTHGQTGSPEFTVWQMMRQRCENQNHVSYPSYGGRGITVCPRWRESFAAFLADMGPRPSRRYTIDRRDNARGYEPDNCYWATPLQQGRNKRNNRILCANGDSMTIAEWCRRLGMKKNTVLNRLACGMSDADALSLPVTHKRLRQRQ